MKTCNYFVNMTEELNKTQTEKTVEINNYSIEKNTEINSIVIRRKRVVLL